jgi:hypothetical protein
MLRTLTSMGLCLAALGALSPGCGTPPVPVEGTLDIPGLDVEFADIGGVHTFGGTSCPQPVGSILITNVGTADVTLEVSETSAQLDLFEIDATGGSTPWATRTLTPDESAEIAVRFNCSATTDISTNIVVSATPTGGTAATDSIPFALDVQGAP